MDLVVGVVLLVIVVIASDGRVIRRHPIAKNGEEGNKDVFVPSNDWQVVKPGQAIPAGLHVRMNIATGLKEARLLEDPALSHENFVKRLHQQDPLRKKKTEEKPSHAKVNHLNHNAVMAVMEEKKENSPPKTAEIANDISMRDTKVEEILAEDHIDDKNIGKKGVGFKNVGFSQNIFVGAIMVGIIVSVLGLMYNKRRSRLIKSLSPSDKIL